MGVPIPLSEARQGFGPKLSLAYNSGQGNGPYGLGWAATIPAITRKTSSGLPRYDDAGDSDVFILAGAEDLVPLLESVDGRWEPELLTDTIGAREFAVRRYRPRVESDFARIERWQDTSSGAVHWRVTSKDNVTSLYGQTSASRISDPGDQTHVFSWLLDLSFDDRGNVISYEYKPEDTANVPPSAHEAGRTVTAARYPKRICYGNRTPYTGDVIPTDWCFEVVFDYGEHDGSAPEPTEAQTWPCRPDPFSAYRGGFEVRTYRRCQHILMFHRFPQELGQDAVIVRSTDFDYGQDDEPTADLPHYSLLSTITQTGWIQPADGGAPKTVQLPPLTLGYSPLAIDDTLRTADADSLENVIGDFDGSRRRWVDLFGEGMQGILSEDDGAWYFKHNLSALTTADKPSVARFGPLELLAEKPRLTTTDAQLQLSDLNGDGRVCAVSFQAPVSGWFELDTDGTWEPLRTFAAANVDWADPNLRFVDLDGDGLADVLITDDDVLTWYRWQAETGFGEVRRVQKPLDEERGPALVFSDGTGSVFLADMSGDGLSDLVRIRSGETSYWPNLGFGQFGKKIVMDGAPAFDNPDLFDQRRLRLADLDGSGTADLIYLGSDATTVWFNEAGNRWTSGRQLNAMPAVDNIAQASVFDLLGGGTAALVWTSSLPQDTTEPLRYVDLTGSVKPYLLTSMANNLGAATTLTYAPSTRFYLEDQAAGSPWLTRLPFPVHVVASVRIEEAVSRTSLLTSYTYHHGFYDPTEREFCGFARVDQLDAESLPQESGTGVFTGTPDSDGDDFALPPVWTRTWYHTGAYVNRVDIGKRLAQEFYAGDGQAPQLGDTSFTPDASTEERREACRALRGRALRQEIYAQDGSSQSVHPYSTSQSRYQVDLLQPPSGASYGAFHVWELESIGCHYERDPTDPRVAHQLTLAIDAYGNVTRSAAVGYPRRASQFAEQSGVLVGYSEVDYINVGDQAGFYRIGLVSEARSYDLTGFAPTIIDGRFDHDALAAAAAAAPVISYEQQATSTAPQRRLLSRSRTAYLKNDLTGPLPFGKIESLVLVDRTYQQIYTSGQLNETFVATGKIPAADLVQELSGPGGFVDLDGDGNQWRPSPRTLFSPDPTSPDQAFAGQHFYLPQGAVDPWENVSTVVYDAHDLLVTQTTDAVANVTTAEHNYRVLGPWLATDPNLNRNGVRYDALGRITATAAMGKRLASGGDEGDHLDTTTPEPSAADDPTTRSEYDLAAYETWAADPNRDRAHIIPVSVHTLTRVRHQDATTPWLESYVFSDGLGRVAMAKAQAEPGLAPARDATGDLVRDDSGRLVLATTDSRWVGTGKVVYDNKGNPVKSYEPFFDSSPGYDDESDLAQWGVTSITRYDPLSRAVRIDNPNGTFRAVETDAWGTVTYDESDTALSSEWYAARANGGLGADEADAAQKAAAHSDTPASADLDVLGRAFRSVLDNGDAGKYATTLTLDIDGRVRSTADALERPVLTQDYDMSGAETHHSSLDSGERWALHDAHGQLLLGWDSRGYRLRCSYDALRRPSTLSVSNGAGAERVAEQVLYGESVVDAQARNLRAVASEQADEAGLVVTQQRDFKGNVIAAQRQLLTDYVGDVDWSTSPTLTDETFVTATAYDALNRVISVTTPDASATTTNYNERSLVAGLSVNLRDAPDAIAILTSATYDAKGQRLTVVLGNTARTTYAYDPDTFRLLALTTTRPGNGGPVQALAYTYDPTGNITRIADTAQQTVFFNGQVVTPSADYTYDAIYRLTTATGREQIGQAGQPQTTWSDAARSLVPLPTDSQAIRNYTENYSYDAVGNLGQLLHTANLGTWTRIYAYGEPTVPPANNRLTSTTVSGTTEPYAHDTHGNLISMPHLSLMQWDWKDQLQTTASQIVNSGTPETAAYRYDPAGERVIKATISQNGKRNAERLYLGACEIYRTYDGNGNVNLERQSLHAGGATGRICLFETTTIDATASPASLPSVLSRYQLSNHLGSAILELDGAAAVITYEEYYPYGSTSLRAGRSAAEVSLKRYRYTGKERDTENGFYYHGARYYAPWLGQWTAVDPAGVMGAINSYGYCAGNPITLVDPQGAAPMPPEAAVLMAQARKLLYSADTHLDQGSQMSVLLESQSGGLINPKLARTYYEHSTEVRRDAAAAGEVSRKIDRYVGATDGLSTVASDALRQVQTGLAQAVETSEKTLAASQVLRAEYGTRLEGYALEPVPGKLVTSQLQALAARGAPSADLLPADARFSGLLKEISQLPVRPARGKGINLYGGLGFVQELLETPTGQRLVSQSGAAIRSATSAGLRGLAKVAEVTGKYLPYVLAGAGAANARRSLVSGEVNTRLNTYHTSRDDPSAGEQLVFAAAAAGVGLLDAVAVDARMGVGDLSSADAVAESFASTGMSPSQTALTEWARVELGLVPAGTR
jgi:RHS repeat-associated protein